MMSIEEILMKLDTNDYETYQREALKAAIQQQEQITPALLNTIECIANNPQFLNDKNPDYTVFRYVLLLLAQFREKRAYPLIVKHFAQLSKDHNALCRPDAEIIYGYLYRILASVCQGDLSLIKQLIEDSTVNVTVRGAALESLVVLYNCDQLSREEIIDYFVMLYASAIEPEEEPAFWSMLLKCCRDIYPGELYDSIDEYFNQRLYHMEWDKNCVNSAMQMGKEQVLEKLKANKNQWVISNVIAEADQWH